LAFLRNKWTITAMLFACWALAASFMAAYYWLQYNDIEDRISGVLIYVNIGIDYGNGTRIFHNNTKALTGATLFDVTKQVSNVTYQVSLYGTEVVSIDSVNKQGSFGWTYWMWNSTSLSWSIVWESADAYKVTDSETFMWYYQSGFNLPQ
jgi:hypothetical protein